MPYQFPEYSSLDLASYGRYQGSSVLAFIQLHCPDTVIVGPEDWKSYKDYDWLDQLITKKLANNKKILLVPGEEEFIYPVNPRAAQVLNQYQHSDVWLVTQLHPDAQKIYSFQHSLYLRQLELPYVLLQLCEEYYKQHNVVDPVNQYTDYNFLCMTGRFEEHKGDLIQMLHKYQLNQHGLITIAPDLYYPDWYKENCKINQMPPAPKTNKLVLDRLIDHNIHNFLSIEREYAQVPLIVQAETSCGIFYTTEKTLWPLLLGKLCLIHGPPGNMKYIQRFYDLAFDRYADLSFDSAPEDWSTKAHRERLNTMIEQNYKLLISCHDVYNSLLLDLESARWSIGKNLYSFLTSQLDTITKEY